MANEKPVRFVNDAWVETVGFNQCCLCAVGKNSGGDYRDGALRFLNVDIGNNESINYAALIYVYSSTGSTSGTWSFRVNGIDQDNTSDLDGNAFSRPQTSAQLNVSEGPPTSGGTKEMNVTSIVQEIVNRGGWSRNNALGLVLRDVSSSNDVYAFADLTDTYLVYRINAQPNFLPTPKTVSAPTFPAADDYGIKISSPGQSVLTADESELLFTTRKDVLKIDAEMPITTESGVPYQIAHGLSYQPQAIGFVRKNGYSFQLPRFLGGATDPVGGGVQGFISSDDTFVTISTTQDATVYVYIFLDELA
jgi:hypothetical protein